MPSLSLENRATNDKARVKALQLFLISHKANESEAGWGPGNGLIDGDSEVTQPGTDGFLKSTYTDNDGVIHSSIDGDFGPATDAAVKAFQQAMVEGNAGVDLGSTGPNQDGVDGKVGTKTGGIVEAALTKVGHQITADLETQVAKANAAAAAAAAAPAAAAAAAAADRANIVDDGWDYEGSWVERWANPFDYDSAFQEALRWADSKLASAEAALEDLFAFAKPLSVKTAQEYNQTVGPDTSLTYEYTTGQPVSGTNAWLRTLSPFCIRLVPPLHYLSNPDVLASLMLGANMEAGTTDNPIRLGLYDAANSSSNSFVSAQAAMQQSKGVAALLAGGTQEAGVTQGGRGTTSAPSAAGTSGDSTMEPALCDYDVAVDMMSQLKSIINAPPLYLLINPETMSISYAKIQQFSERTRYGYIYQTWGEEQPKLTFSGRIGAFYSTGTSDNNGWTTTPSGVQFASKRNSAAFKNLMTLFTYYKNNGYIYDNIGKSNAMQHVGLVAIDYDGYTYLGNFNSFGWGYEEALHGGGISFDLDFTVVQKYDNKGGIQTPPMPQKSPVETPETYSARGADFTNSTSRSAQVLLGGADEGLALGAALGVAAIPGVGAVYGAALGAGLVVSGIVGAANSRYVWEQSKSVETLPVGELGFEAAAGTGAEAEQGEPLATSNPFMK